MEQEEKKEEQSVHRCVACDIVICLSFINGFLALCCAVWRNGESGMRNAKCQMRIVGGPLKSRQHFLSSPSAL